MVQLPRFNNHHREDKRSTELGWQSTSRRFQTALVLLGFIFGLGLLASHLPAQETDPALALFKKHCRRCHGDDGKGKKLLVKILKLEDRGVEALNLTREQARGLTDDEMVKIIQEGLNQMKSYKDKISVDETRLLVGHIRNLQKKATEKPTK